MTPHCSSHVSANMVNGKHKHTLYRLYSCQQFIKCNKCANVHFKSCFDNNRPFKEEDTMRPQFFGLDWECHLQYPWNVRGMTAEMEGGWNASDRLDRKEMSQNSVREHEQEKLKSPSVLLPLKIKTDSTWWYFPPTTVLMSTNLLNSKCIIYSFRNSEGCFKLTLKT